MKLSMRWLKEYVPLTCTPEIFMEQMTMTGSKAEGYEIEGAMLKNIVVGKILDIQKHPNADKLQICKTDVGEDRYLQIITAATNVFTGAFVPVCLHGAQLADGRKIKKGKLRGEVSEGMFCSLQELGLSAHDFPYAAEDGIFIIEEPCAVGQSIQEAIGLNDIVVSFEITSNRPDCLSVLGLAREAAATFQKPLQVNPPEKDLASENAISQYLQVDVQEPKLCRRYMAKVIKNVNIQASPRFIRERLRASGVRPINNLVDITNYIMLAYGQPMHAFDYRFVEDGKIVVRCGGNKEKITTLDGIQRDLDEQTLVIADAKKPIGIAGVMGGEYSGIMKDTTMVVLESACFDGACIRNTSKKLGIRTESSSRYEKGLPAAQAEEALFKACELIKQLGVGEVVEGYIDIYPSKDVQNKILFDPNWIRQFLGAQISDLEMKEILQRLGFTFSDDWILTPDYRVDISSKADIAEEVARIYGYDKLPSTVIRGIADGKIGKEESIKRLIGNYLQASGLYEIYTYSFISEKDYQKTADSVDKELNKIIEIQNPLGEDTKWLRTTMIPSMLNVLKSNYQNANAKARFYEIGKVYQKTQENKLPNEVLKLITGMYGEADFYTLKGVVETLLEGLHIEDFTFLPFVHPAFHSGRCAKLFIHQREAGILGEINPNIQKSYEIGERIYIGYLDFTVLMEENRREEIRFKPLPKFPALSRDLSLLCKEELPAMQVEQILKENMGELLEEIKLFDVYRGKQIEEGYKSLSYTIRLRNLQQTITDKEADVVLQKTLEQLKTKGVFLREI